MMASVFVAIGSVCAVTTLLDMAMNGNGEAHWAPWGVALSVVAFVIAGVFG